MNAVNLVTGTALCISMLLPAQKSIDARIDTGGSTSASGRPRLAVEGTRIHAVWNDYRLGGGRVFTNRSLNGGATWAADVLVPTASDTDHPTIATDDGLVHMVAWANGTVYNRSLDAGATWEPNATVLDAAFGSHFPTYGSASVACDGQVVCVVWVVSDLTGAGATYAAQCSADGGQSWLPTPFRIDTGTPTTTAVLSRPVATVQGTKVAVVFLDPRPGSIGVWCRTSTDAGVNWATSSRLSAANAIPRDPTVAQDGNRLHVAWPDWRSGARRLLHVTSPDLGGTWSTVEHRIDQGQSTASGSVLYLAASGNSVHACWDEQLLGQSSSAVQTSSSTDNGTTWTPASAPLSPPNTWARAIGIAAEGPAVVAAWYRWDLGPPVASKTLWMSRSLNTGTTWSTEKRLDHGPGDVNGGELRAAAGSFHAAFEDYRGDQGIWYALAAGWQQRGSGLAGTTSPQLTGRGPVMAGATFACDLTSGPANGVAVIGLALGLSSQVAVPAFGGTLLVAASVLSTVVLDPAGAVTLPIVAPPSPSLRGLNVNAQGAVLDVGAPQSIALTAAIEFWLG